MSTRIYLSGDVAQIRDGADDCHGSHKNAIRNKQDERILELAEEHGLVMANNQLKKKLDICHLHQWKDKTASRLQSSLSRNDLKNTVIRPTAMYDSEYWRVNTKSQKLNRPLKDYETYHIRIAHS